MKSFFVDTLQRMARWLGKSAPAALTGPSWSSGGHVDAFKRNRPPTPQELLSELKNTAFTCASINASVCASYPPRLYVTTAAGQPRPKCQTGPLQPKTETRLRSRSDLPGRVGKAQHIEEVFDHPLLTLLQRVNPIHNQLKL